MNQVNPKGETQDESAWAIVELMGHQVVAGLVSKSTMFGPPLMRVDVPETSAFPAFTQMFGADGPIYRITFVSEEVARLTAEQIKVNPVSVYVPDLITKEKHEQAIEKLHRQMESLRRALPAGDEGDDDEIDY